MSVRQMSKVWELDLEPNKRLVLLAYADHADDDGAHVFPSLDRVAHKTGYSRDQTKRISRQLRDDGLMELVAEGRGRGNPSEYRLTLENGCSLPPFKSRREKGASEPPIAPEKGASESKKGAPMPPEPSQRTVKEPSGSEEETSSSSGRPLVSSGDEAEEPPVPRDGKSAKAVSWRSYCHQRSREIQSEARELGWKPDTLPEKTVGEWSAFYQEAIQRDGYTVEELDSALWWLFRKASGLIEGEQQAWAYFGRAMRESEKECTDSPTAGAEDPEQQALAEQNRRTELFLLYGDNIPPEIADQSGEPREGAG